MKVLILTQNYPRKNALMNGVFIHQQVKALQLLGIECHVLLLHNWYPRFSLHKYHPTWQEGFAIRQSYFEEYEDVQIHHVPVVLRMPDRIFRNNYYVEAAKAVSKYVNRNRQLKNADWLYAHFLTDYAYIAALAKQQLHMKLAAIARGDDVHAWPEKNPSLVRHLQYVFAHADMLLANSARLAADTQMWMQDGICREVKVVYNGVDHEKFFPVKNHADKERLRMKYQLSTKYKYMICVATPVKLKGWMELLNAVKALGNRLNGWRLLMVAPKRSNDDALDLVALSEELGIGDKIIYMGQLSPADLAELYRASDVFVLPSYNEGMANALLEAMSSGLACIATDVGGHAEVIQNDRNGLLIAPQNTEELANALDKLCNDDDRRKLFSASARERMLQFGDYTKNARQLHTFLQSHKAGSQAASVLEI